MTRRKKATYEQLVDAVAHAQRNVTSLLHEIPTLHPLSDARGIAESKVRIIASFVSEILYSLSQKYRYEEFIRRLTDDADSQFRQAMSAIKKYREKRRKTTDG